MAAGLSTFAENKLVDAVLRAQALGAPATLYVGLMTCTKGVRANTTAYALNDTIVVLNTVDNLYHLYKCTTAGSTAGSQPATYLGNNNEVITDGTAVFTEQQSGLAAGTAVVEVSGGAYARVAVTSGLTQWAGTQGAGTTVASSGTSGQSSNNGVVTFPTSTAAWAAAPAMVWGICIYDALTVGNLWLWGPLTTPQNIGIGNTPSFSAGTLTVTLA